MNNYKLADVQNLEMTIEKRQGYKSFGTQYGQTPFRVGQLIDWKNSSPEDGNFEACAPQKGVKKADWAWKVEEYDSTVWQEKFSWKVDVKGEGEGYIDLNEKQNKSLMDCIRGVDAEEDAIIKVKKEALKTADGKSTYSMYKFTLQNVGDAPE